MQRGIIFFSYAQMVSLLETYETPYPHIELNMLSPRLKERKRVRGLLRQNYNTYDYKF
jgi:hypothetical protein